MPEFTIVIPHRGNPLGLWATIHSIEEDLKPQKFDHNYVIVTNGGEIGDEAEQTIEFVDRAKRLKKHLHFEEPLTPPAARQRGAVEADGKTLFFFDNHCLVGGRYFERAVAEMDAMGIDMLHSTTSFYAGQPVHYHYKLRLDYNFWASSALTTACDYKPYKIAAAGHGGFAIRREVFHQAGGYGPEDLFKGYGGEEMIFDLKMWRYGRNNFLSPRMIHYHYTGARGYARHYTDDYYTNLLVSAHVIGGEKWLYKVFDSFLNKSHIRLNPKMNWYDILTTAYYRSADYAREVDKNSKMTLDELLIWFRENCVAM